MPDEEAPYGAAPAQFQHLGAWSERLRTHAGPVTARHPGGPATSDVSPTGACALASCDTASVHRGRFAHEALVVMALDADDRAPGGAITVALCGRSDHDPPCPLAPHHTRAERAGNEVRLRILFAARPDDELRVRAMIDGALAEGTGATPEGRSVSWRLVSTGAEDVRPDEHEHAERLAQS